MKKVLVTLLVTGFCFFGFFAAGFADDGAVVAKASNDTQQPVQVQKNTNTGCPICSTVCCTTTPLKLCFWPDVWYWPAKHDVYGLSFGFPVAYGDKEPVYGLDLALFLAMSDGDIYGWQLAPVTMGYNVKGTQTGVVNMVEGMDGAQVGAVNMVKGMRGAQLGVVNLGKEVNGAQLGIVNLGKQASGFQLGLVNFLDNGFCPVFPFFNFSCK